MSSLLPRLFLALFACSAAVACEEEGPDGDETTEAASGSEGDATDDATGAATAGATVGSLAMPPDEDGESTTDDGDTGSDTRGPATSLAAPKFE